MTVWCRSSARIELREVRALVGAAALLAQQRAARRSGARAGAGRRAARAARRASRTRPAWRHSALARLAAGAAAGRRRRRRRPAAGRRGSASAARAARAPKHEALAQRVRGQPVGAVQAGARALADRVEARARVARAVEVGRRRRPSRSARRARPGTSSRRRVEPGLAQRGDDVGEERRVDRAHVEADAVGRPSRASVARSARATSSRGASSSTKRSPSRVEQRRALAADRLGDQEALAARGRRSTAVGWNCMNSRSASAAPAAWASSSPMPSEPGGLVVRAHSAAAPPVARTTARARIARAVLADDARRSGRRAVQSAAARARPRAPSIRSCSATSAESWRMIAPAGRAAAGVDDAPRASGRPRGRARGCRGGRRRSARRARSRSRDARRRLVGTAPRAATRAHERRARRARCPRRCRSGESSAASAAARPPCAQ